MLQTVTVTGVDDPDADGNRVYQITGPATSTDPVYSGIKPVNVTVTNLDNNDTAGVTVSSLASQGVSSITRAGSMATVTSTAHDFCTGDSIAISGATQPEYNGTFPSPSSTPTPSRTLFPPERVTASRAAAQR